MEEKLKVLVVDDEQIVMDAINKHLKNEDDLSLEFASQADTALELIKAEHFDIVLTDLMMPIIDGLELLKIIKDKNPDAIVIIITGYATINTALQAMQLGALDYLAKPFTKEELKKLTRRAVGIARALALKPKNSDLDSKSKELTAKTSLIRGIGEGSWFIREGNGNILIGIERTYLLAIGSIQSIYLPSRGDELRQGSVYFQIFSSDLRTQSLMSPFSGIVTDVNESALIDNNIILQDPYAHGWLIRLSPTNYDDEIKMMGL